MEGLSLNLDDLSLNGSNGPLHPEVQGARMHTCVHMYAHTRAGWARSPCLAGCQETRPRGLSQSGRDAQSSTDGLVARGQCSGSGGRIGCWSQVAGRFPDDLQSHGDTGELGHSVGQGAGGRWKLSQVGHGVHHAAQEEEQEVHPGHERIGPQEGVDEAQEQEGVDGLHVIPVGSEKVRTCSQPSVSFENVMGAGALGPERPCTPGENLRGARLKSTHGQNKRHLRGGRDSDSKLAPASGCGSKTPLTGQEPWVADWGFLTKP